MNLVNIELANKIYETAVLRGQYNGVNKKDIILNTLDHISKEKQEAVKALDEYMNCTYSCTNYNPDSFEAELIDIMFISISLCCALEIDINKEAIRKLEYNINRVNKCKQLK